MVINRLIDVVEVVAGLNTGVSVGPPDLGLVLSCVRSCLFSISLQISFSVVMDTNMKGLLLDVEREVLRDECHERWPKQRNDN